jgi:1-deoxy-D-xylulose-5-phosphate reductoisomerase
MAKIKRLAVFGSTGSIGCCTLDIVAMHPDRFKAVVLCADTRVDILSGQIRRFKPEVAVVRDEEHACRLKDALAPGLETQILFGNPGYLGAAANRVVDMVVMAVVGAAGLAPTLAAIDAGKDIALANKETLVMAGSLVMARAREKPVRIFPVDSEHSAIFQSLAGNRRQDLQKIYLTASGGPFRKLPKERFGRITKTQALAHPNWKMGPKITIDSATLMNKGLEVIEAHWLFNVSPQDIDVLIHPQSIVHSMVAYRDGSVIAQLGKPEMKGAIAYALSWPERIDTGVSPPDFAEIGSLNFEKPDLEKFPCLGLAMEACRRGGTLPAVLNAANEIAVEAFLADRLLFPEISVVVENALSRHAVTDEPGLNEILKADQWARAMARERILELR